ncbi:MAG: ABC transporter ATP-binding protein, partial [Chloroflexi bacterium]|nr:ABC transporter ATP-binding protein [Chloroflexota bacterium]
MSEPIIKVKNLSKRYRIGAREQYKTFREAIIDGISAPVRNLGRLRRMTRFKDGDEADVIWALKDVSFDVSEGEVLGIIGRNGAGKTTVLKILSRITEPTGGFAEIYGRVSSLLEVGTGFHPELTGRENIFLNGAILGMRKREIEQKFDEIIAFAELEKFLDTPVKRYSSGMYVRLAFAVAAHLEPEVLLVDEVLAVGDIAFQQKCLGKMEEVAKGGRTVLFVSHNMGAIRNLCNSVLWLDSGQVVKKGATDEVVRDYEEQMLKHFDKSSYVVERNPEEVKGKSFYFSRVEMRDARGENTNLFRYNDTLVLLVDFAGELAGGNFCPEFYLHNELGQLVSVGSSGVLHSVYFGDKVRKVRIDIG